MTFSRSASSYASTRDVMEGMTVLLVDAVSLSALFFAFFHYVACCDHICRLHQCEQIIAIIEELLHALTRVAWVTDEDMPNAFLEY